MSKAVKFSISLTSEQHEKALQAAQHAHGGNLSRYFQALLDRDGTSDEVAAGAEAFVKFTEQYPGNYTDRLQRAVVDKRPFAEIARELCNGDAGALALLRQAYDFLAGTMKTRSLPPVMTVLMEIRDMLRAGAVLPDGILAEQPQHHYGSDTSLPSAASVHPAPHKGGADGKAAGAPKPRRSQPRPKAKSPGGE